MRLDTGIDVDLTATSRTGFATFRFPTRTGYLAFDAGGGATDQSAVAVSRLGASAIRGLVTDDGFCGGPASPTIHFVARFDRPIASVLVLGRGRARRSPASRARTTINTGGALLGFRLPPSRTLRVAIGISYVSTANAPRTSPRKAAGRGTARRSRGRPARAGTASSDRIRVEGGTPAQRRTFATALYHSLIHPSLASDVNGQYRGRDGVVRTARGYRRYTHISGWDTYRTQMPLLALLTPRVASDVARSLVEGAKEGARGEVGARRHRDRDHGRRPRAAPRRRRAGLRRAALRRGGRVPGAARRTEPAGGPFVYPSHEAPLDGAPLRGVSPPPGLGDYLTRGYVPLDHDARLHPRPGRDDARVRARGLRAGPPRRSDRRARDAAGYRLGAGNWRRLFNPATRYIEPRLADGSFVPGVLAHDRGRLRRGQLGAVHVVRAARRRRPGGAHGRRAGGARPASTASTAISTRAISRRTAWLGNEPSFGTPWLYNWLGAPWRTQAVVRRAVNTLFRPLPAGLPGDDDLGALSAWYVWSALGLYPAIPGVGGLAIASPLFPSVTIVTGFGRLRIEAPGAAAGRPYVHELTLDGRPYERTWLPVSALRGTRTLRFELGSAPDRSWATGRAARPPSFPRG